MLPKQPLSFKSTHPRRAGTAKRAFFFSIISVCLLVAAYNTYVFYSKRSLSIFGALHRISKFGAGERPGGSKRPGRPGGRPFLEGSSTGAAAGLAVDPRTVVMKRPQLAAGARKKRYFHTAMTVNESPYGKWQSRVMYYYYKKFKDEPDSEMGGFTRVLHSGFPDNLMDEIPTFVVDPLPPGLDKGYVVLNRPYAFKQWLERAHIEEEYIFMAEPDHIILRPIPNLATDKMPAAFSFFYIVPREQEKHLRRWYPEERGPITDIDPIGNSPVIIKKDYLKLIAPLWVNISIEMKKDPLIDKDFGWVLEMYAYATSSAILGYQHVLRRDFMVQPPWDTKLGNAFILHFTYGCDYNPQGQFTPGKVGEWHFDKRDYQSAIPKNLSFPPKGAPETTIKLIQSLNDATWSLPNWKAGAMK